MIKFQFIPKNTSLILAFVFLVLFIGGTVNLKGQRLSRDLSVDLLVNQVGYHVVQGPGLSIGSLDQRLLRNVIQVRPTLAQTAQSLE